MPATFPRLCAAAVLVAVTGCGSDHMTTVDPGEFRALATSLSVSAEQHRVNMSGAVGGACSAEMDRYAAEIGPPLERMRQMSAAMDACMSRMGHSDAADMASTCAAMRSELDEHLATGCGVSDPAAEATRHADAMRQMAEHEADRAETMAQMMPASGMMSVCRM
jgi:hypothetical protein